MKYFSDSERGALPRTKNEIPHNVWLGVTAYIQGLIDTGWFGEQFPELCPDGQGCYGTNERTFSSALQAEVLGITYPFVTEEEEDPESWCSQKVSFTPSYLDILDLVQFCYVNVSKPTFGRQYHSYYGHYHIASFDSESAKDDFLEKINTIFSRNGLAYELLGDGQIIRVISSSLNSVIQQIQKTSEHALNDLLEHANRKICNPDVRVRYEALKELWDAFERIKTILKPENKKQSMTILLESCSSDTAFRSELEAEARTLTNIGNKFFIRHSEMSQIKLSDSDHIEYLFHRLASFMLLLTKKLG
ncbi:AbiJ-NTD4 domain-containing protein [Vibrio parahaemolyticus]|uniref:AbiJ-NTD4 domain-containing protein n=1 Tax=Vibrio parahaemolyticus TaxID=670 RepID=UPI0015BCB08D|nr:stationary phase or STEss regulating sigma factor [Vibrio parahaemolyticus]QLE29996.1 stationary phase or STEss regulating sigma factor [Vibrio parahaemolyticus]